MLNQYEFFAQRRYNHYTCRTDGEKKILCIGFQLAVIDTIYLLPERMQCMLCIVRFYIFDPIAVRFLTVTRSYAQFFN
jgi:hypothetical protein